MTQFIKEVVEILMVVAPMIAFTFSTFSQFAKRLSELECNNITREEHDRKAKEIQEEIYRYIEATKIYQEKQLTELTKNIERSQEQNVIAMRTMSEEIDKKLELIIKITEKKNGNDRVDRKNR